MTDKDAELSAQNLQDVPGIPFKKGYDPRRWMKGAPKKPKDKKRAEELIEHIIWDVFSEELTSPKGEKIDRLRAMIRSMTTSRQSADKQELLNRTAGKVVQVTDIQSGGKDLSQIGINIIDYRSDITETKE